MSTIEGHVLTLNCGSSSLKYALFAGDGESEQRSARSTPEESLARGSVAVGEGWASDHAAAVRGVFDDLASRGLAQPGAVGHRVVHGGPEHLAPERVDTRLLASLRRAVPFAPLHLPAELRAIEAVRERFGDVPQVVCFDTSFHRTLPERAHRYPLPATLADAGLRRYGFHGLSYEYAVEELGAKTLGRAVLAHLGSGASMAAVLHGRCIDTTMGLTPTGGLVMGTRSGNLDPGLLLHLLEHRGFDARSLDRLVNAESGLLALSGTTPDMRQLLGASATDVRAALAVEIFCYQARKWVGALTAALGGIDTLVFTGGIGERASAVRRHICLGLAHLGVALDEARNLAGDRTVSAEGSACAVYVVRTDEERMIARHTRRVLSGKG